MFNYIGVICYIFWVPLLKHWHPVLLRRPRVSKAFAWLYRCNRGFTEAQCLSGGANGIEVDTLKATK